MSWDDAANWTGKSYSPYPKALAELGTSHPVQRTGNFVWLVIASLD